MQRQRALDNVLSSTEQKEFYDRLYKELREIEQINIRVEKDIEFKKHERIRKFGVDG